MPKIFEIFTLFDWITPVVKSAEAWGRDPLGRAGKCVVDHGAAIAAGWDQTTITSYLAQNGVFIFGQMYDALGDSFGFYIPPEQYDNAAWLLGQAGIPVERMAR